MEPDNSYTIDQRITQLCFQSLSILSTALILYRYFRHKESRSVGLYLVLMISISDSIFALVNMIIICSASSLTEQKRSSDDILCDIQGYFLLFSQQFVYLNGAIFIYSLYKTVYKFEPISQGFLNQLYGFVVLYALVTSIMY